MAGFGHRFRRVATRDVQLRVCNHIRLRAVPILQAALAAGLAWLLARLVLDERQAMFAPIATIVALLGSSVGARGRQALVLMLGVGVGVVVGELLLGALHRDPASVALAAAAAMLVVSFVHDNRLAVIQAGIASVIVVTVGDPAIGAGRILSAVIGGVVALVFTQVLLTPSPTRLLATAMSEVLRPCAQALDDTRRVLRGNEGEGRADSRDLLYEELPSALTGLAEARRSARSMSRRTVRGRRESARLALLDQRAGHLARVAADVVRLRRVADADHPELAEPVAALTEVAGTLATDPHSAEACGQAQAAEAETERDGALETTAVVRAVAAGLALVAAPATGSRRSAQGGRFA